MHHNCLHLTDIRAIIIKQAWLLNSTAKNHKYFWLILRIFIKNRNTPVPTGHAPGAVRSPRKSLNIILAPSAFALNVYMRQNQPWNWVGHFGLRIWQCCQIGFWFSGWSDRRISIAQLYFYWEVIWRPMAILNQFEF